MFFVETKEVSSVLYAIGRNLFCWNRVKCNNTISTPILVPILANIYFVSKTVSKIVGVGRSMKSSILLDKMLAKTDLVSKNVSNSVKSANLAWFGNFLTDFLPGAILRKFLVRINPTCSC